MPASVRDVSRDREPGLRRQHSFSESGRPIVPMWDSSDPDRAPPPLPLNPGTPQAATRPNTSANIAAAAQAIVGKARENDGPTLYTYSANAIPERSPERSLIKGAHHRRLQSLQTGSVRDLRSFIDGGKSPERSPSRMENGYASDYYGSSPERSPSRAATPTPSGIELLKETPTLRPSTRAPPRPILGENTPPSATMLALQTMPVRDTDSSLSNISHSPSVRSPLTFDAISTQILSLTHIATNLQREMAQLSRRSKDNATDLISLKEATHTRDEDIRKTLRELVNSVNSDRFLAPPSLTSRATSSFGNGMHFLDNKAHNSHGSPPSVGKSFSLPRIPSVNSFAAALDAERAENPAPYSLEGAASVAMLEKIIREMVTKEGQERLVSTISDLLGKAEQSNHGSEAAVKKVEELMDFIRGKLQSQAIIQRVFSGQDAEDRADTESEMCGTLTRMANNHDGPKPYASPKAADFVSAEMLNLLRKIKDSVTESGGMTAETKALVRELRGEVLGMGRELGRKLDEKEVSQGALVPYKESSHKEELEQIVNQGLAELREHMERVIRENRRRSNASDVSNKSVDEQQIYAVVKHTLASQGLSQAQAAQSASSPLDKEAIIGAVKEAYEAYKPEIELQQFGLERDEILQCLREGLEDYRSHSTGGEAVSIRKDEILEVFQEALLHFTPPAPVSAAQEIRDEVLVAVRACLDDFKFPNHETPVSRGAEITRLEVLEAVKEGLAAHGPGAPRELEINRDDLYQAVKAGLDGKRTPLGGYGEQVLNQLQELVEGMRVEFKQYSAANGRDTEQVLDAVKDGLESLRAEIETYVDRAQDVTGKDEIIDTVRSGLEQLRADVEGYAAIGPQGENALSKSEILEYIKAEFEHLHETLGHDASRGAGTSKDREDIAIILRDVLDKLKSQAPSRGIDEEHIDEMLDAMKQEFEQLRDAVLSSSTAQKDEIVEMMQDSLQGLHAKLGSRDGESEVGEAMLSHVRQELANLRETLSTTVIRSSESGDKEGYLEVMGESLDALRTQLAADQQEATGELLGLVKEEVEHLREHMGISLIRGDTNQDQVEMLNAIKLELENMSGRIGQTAASEAGNGPLGPVREELEHLRQSIATSLLSGRDHQDTEEILDTVRLGLDDLRSHLDKKLDNPDRQISSTSEILDGVNEGLDALRIDIAKVVDKPVDMTVSYEILDAVRDGLASVRADIEKLKDDRPSTGHTSIRGKEMMLVDDEGVLSRESPTVERGRPAIQRSDVDRLEVMLAQLQIKVEAMDQNIQSYQPVAAAEPVSAANAVAPEGAVRKDDLTEIESALKELQTTVSALAARKQVGSENAATKEDTDAIETLVRITKAHIDDLRLPDPELAVTKEDLYGVEMIVRTTEEAVHSLAGRMTSEAATKDDLGALETLVLNTKAVLEEMREDLGPRNETANVSQTDIEVLGILCAEIKTKLEQMALPEPGSLASKGDIEALAGLIHDFKVSHEKMSNRYETDIAVTARAFDDRKAEAETLVERIAGLRDFLEDMKEHVIAKLEQEGQDTESFASTLKDLEASFREHFGISADVKELVATINREFGRTHDSIEQVKAQHDESARTLYGKHDEHKAALTAQIGQKLDMCFSEIIARYDNAQIVAEEKQKHMETTRVLQDGILSDTKSMAEELKLTIDTLGISLATLEESLTETTNRMGDDSKTVYNRVEQTYSKLEEAHADSKTEHSITRDAVSVAVTEVTGLRGEVGEFHPKFMDTLKNVLMLVGQHYEHFQKAHEQSQKTVESAFEESRSQSRAHAEDMKSIFSSSFALTATPASQSEQVNTHNDREVYTKLDSILERSSLLPDKMDTLLDHVSGTRDIHQKLNQLADDAAASRDSMAQLERLDKIHEQVLATAAEVSQFVSLQAKQITEDQESREKEAEELSLLLERRLAQKEQLESSIAGLIEEKESICSAVEALQADKDALSAQKLRLAADVSCLETALQIRREELDAMDAKADALERRIVEGLIDHSRALLLAKTSKGPASMSLKRVHSGTPQRTPDSPSTTPTGGLGMALKSRTHVRRAAPAERRIFSLNQITNNIPTGNRGYSAAPSASNSGFGNLKRSHSVRSNNLKLKNGTASHQPGSEVNKENEMQSESDHENRESDASTERLSSYQNGTGSDLTYGTGSYRSASVSSRASPGTGRRSAFASGDSEYTYGTGSYVTGSDVDRRTSFGSTVRSQLGTGAVVNEPLNEEDESDRSLGHERGSEHDGYEKQEQRLLKGQEDGLGDVVMYKPPHSDSGLGTDLPSAAVGGSGVAEYFKA